MILTIYIILGIILIIFIWGVFTFNYFINLVNSTKDAWSGVEVQLKRRYDLIPNLVQIVKGYAKHEKQVFTQVAELRSKAASTKSLTDKENLNNQITDTIKSIFAIAENYPQLLASNNFLALQADLKETENKIAGARSYYNANVRDLNTLIEKFPYNLMAKIFGFQKRDFFALDPSQAELQKIEI